MKLQHPSVKVFVTNYQDILAKIVEATSLCYGKEIPKNMTQAERERFIVARLDMGHESVVEHASISVLITADRGVTHELVRHRLASYTQSSTRYMDGLKHGLSFIIPCWCHNLKAGVYENTTPVGKMTEGESIWFDNMIRIDNDYKALRGKGWLPEQARSILPNSTAANIMVTANIREWRHILALRAKGTTGKPHPQMRQIMYPIWMALHDYMPAFFEEPDKPMFEIQGCENVEVDIECA